jgi:uncharacterized caspase-like protein
MSEDTSLTNAVKLVAGISLTNAVKDVAGRRGWFVDEGLDTQDGATQEAITHRAPRLLAASARLAAFALLTLTFLHAASTSTVLDAPRGLLPTAHGRVALVVGNSAYRHTPKLENPKNDAADMGAALKKLGFHVIEGFDLDKEAFDAKVRDFADALKGADVGVFFYAGHGMQASGQNYLVPVDAKLTAVSALSIETVRLDLVQQAMEREAKTNLLFLDACRDNPLARNLARAVGAQPPEIGRGLAPVESGAGTLIGFSTQPGNVALDGAGRNSPFSGALVRHLGASNKDLNAILIAVRNDVMRQTDRKQVPWEHSALTRRFYFNPAIQTSAAARATQLRWSEAADAWSATRDTASFAVLDAFVARYGDTFFAELARARAEELGKRVTPPLPSPSEADVTAASSR